MMGYPFSPPPDPKTLAKPETPPATDAGPPYRLMRTGNARLSGNEDMFSETVHPLLGSQRRIVIIPIQDDADLTGDQQSSEFSS
jgi:hypothetical protein